MDYVYGEISQKALANTYTGGRTSTADVTVDNVNNIIYVAAHADSEYVEDLIEEKISELDKPDAAVLHQFVDSVSETDGIIDVHRRSLVYDDIPTLPISKTQGLQAALDSKQAVLGFEDEEHFPYDKNTNKVVTKDVMDDTIEHLEGSMHYLGTTTTIITEGSTVTEVVIGGQTVTVQKGDLVSYPDTKKKWHFNGTSWNNYIDMENAIFHVSGGDVADADVKASADINQTKIHGLRTSGNNTLCGDVGYLDKIDILVSDDSTPGSIAKSIKDAIEALDVSDESVAGQFVTAISESNGLISVTRRAFQQSDFAANLIAESSVQNLTSDLASINTAISNMHLKKDGTYAPNNEYEFETGKILSKIQQANGIVNIIVRDLAEADIPTISYTKISNWPQANWTETDSTKQSFILNKPTITYNNSLHCLVLERI